MSRTHGASGSWTGRLDPTPNFRIPTSPSVRPPLYPKSIAALLSAAAEVRRTAAQGRNMKISSIAIFALMFVVSVATMFAADPPPWAYGFEGPPQAGAKPTPIG